ncbi:MAG: GNAT family N-acetyltransferase [Bacteroidetes bacterium 4484_249]|nr:MAG: GNAT family N-acetyltransferase [Bacteroidetes bacterium 4484_249]
MCLKLSLLNKSHDRTRFNCGNKSLDNYIKHQVSQDIRKKLSVCFVLSNKSNIVKGYYTLSNSSISKNNIPEKFSKKIPASYSNIPVTLLGRLAIDISIKGKGHGEYLLIDALRECYRVLKKTIGSFAVVVEPINNEALSFYKKYDFIMLPNSGKMFLSMNVISKLFPNI